MKYIGCIVMFFAATVLNTAAQEYKVYPQEKDRSIYLFTYFTGNKVEDESIHFAVSADGYNYIALNNNQLVFDSKIISSYTL